jgi:ketosteroid isomerase-like protein
MTRLPLVVTGALFAAASAMHAQGTRPDSAGAIAVVDQYNAALTAGDSARAVSLLAEDVIILESGAIETRAEYIGHHLGADIKASQGSKGVRTIVRVSVQGDVAYVASKTVNPPSGAPGNTGSEMAELMVLSRSTGTWKISAIHWSSRRRRG